MCARASRSLVWAMLAAALAVALSVRPARAEIESDLVKQGVAAYDELEYQRAVDLLQRALKETLTREERAVTWRTLAFSYVALDKRADAEKAFAELLRADPGYQPDRTVSPRVRAVFESAKSRVATEGLTVGTEAGLSRVQATVTPLRPKQGQPVTVRLRWPGGVAETAELFYRTRGQTRFSRIEVKPKGDRFEVTVPGLAVAAPALEWYLDLLDDTGSAVATAGTLGRPMAVDVAAPPVPVYKKGWFWGTLAGIAIAGAVVGGVLGATLPSKIGPDTPATLSIMPH